eukprot:5296213-Amphidinium_carterae.1
MHFKLAPTATHIGPTAKLATIVDICMLVRVSICMRQLIAQVFPSVPTSPIIIRVMAYNQLNAFKNLLNRGSKDDTRNAQLGKLASSFAEVPKSQKAQFVKEFYMNCGPKGDMDAFMEQRLTSSTKTTSGSSQGWLTPGQIATGLNVSRDDFETKEAYQEALQEEILKNQEEHQVPPEDR